MTSYGSLCRGSGLSKKLSLVSQRLARPVLAKNAQRMAGREAVRALSSVPPRPSEAASSTQRLILQTNPNNHPRKEDSKAAESLEESSTTSSPLMRTSPLSLTYTGGVTMPVTTQLKIVTPEEDAPRGVWPVYRLMVRQMMSFVPNRPFRELVESYSEKVA